MSTYAYSDIYDCAICEEALAYPVDEEGEALDGGDLVCLTCVLSYVVDMRTGTLVRASEFIERLIAELEQARGGGLVEPATAADPLRALQVFQERFGHHYDEGASCDTDPATPPTVP